MSKDWYIWIDGVKVSVSEDVYRTYKRAEWREEKQDAVRRDRECSFDYMEEHDLDGQVVSRQELVDEIVADKLLLDELYAALAELTDDERSLIDELFFKEKSEREVSREAGISAVAVHKRKHKILDKLRRFIEK